MTGLCNDVTVLPLLKAITEICKAVQSAESRASNDGWTTYLRADCFC